MSRSAKREINTDSLRYPLHYISSANFPLFHKASIYDLFILREMISYALTKLLGATVAETSTDVYISRIRRRPVPTL